MKENFKEKLEKTITKVFNDVFKKKDGKQWVIYPNDFDVCIGNENGNPEWDEEKRKKVSDFIKAENAKRTPEQRKRTEELAEKYRKQDEEENKRKDEN